MLNKVGEALVIKPDEPYYKKYYIDFISLNRTFSSSAESAGVGDVGTSSVSSTADNDFWAGLESTIQIILDGDAVGGGAGVTAGSNDPNLLQWNKVK